MYDLGPQRLSWGFTTQERKKERKEKGKNQDILAYMQIGIYQYIHHL